MKCCICAKPVLAKFTPFCSERCKMLDLGKWLDGGYVIATDEVTDDEDKADDEDKGDQD